jgi:hypothetical protein
MKRMIVGAAAAMLMSAPVLACPEFPHHPNMHNAAADLCKAQKAMHEAIEANKKELGGHGEAAEKAMHEAMEQIEQAAKFANEHHK